MCTCTCALLMCMQGFETVHEVHSFCIIYAQYHLYIWVLWCRDVCGVCLCACVPVLFLCISNIWASWWTWRLWLEEKMQVCVNFSLFLILYNSSSAPAAIILSFHLSVFWKYFYLIYYKFFSSLHSALLDSDSILKEVHWFDHSDTSKY